jgi:hypothetical protein
MLELKRSDLRLGRVIIDDLGVTRRGLFGTTRLAWGEVRDYRLTIELKPLSNLLTSQIGLLGDLMVLMDLGRGNPAFKLGIDLHGEGKHVAFNWRFKGVELGIAHVLQRIGEPLIEQARAQLTATGSATFGPIQLSRDHVRWGDRVVERDAVESIEIFDNSPLEIRVMAHGKAWPVGHAPTSKIPNLVGLMRLAHELGYAVKGSGILQTLQAPAPRPTARD